MHLRLYFIAAVVTAIVGCNKKSTSKEEIRYTTLEGTWELNRTFGGMMPASTYEPGKGNLLKFTSTQYRMSRNGQIISEGNYRLAADSVVDVNSCAKLPPDSTPNWIIAENNSGFKTSFKILENTLTLTSGCIPADGGGSVYKKVGNGE